MNKRGRPSLRDEVAQMTVINKSWDLIGKALMSKEVTDEEKKRIALEICKRTAPKDVNLQVSIEAQVNQIIQTVVQSIPSPEMRLELAKALDASTN
jgi:hypothetical protein